MALTHVLTRVKTGYAGGGAQTIPAFTPQANSLLLMSVGPLTKTTDGQPPTVVGHGTWVRIAVEENSYSLFYCHVGANPTSSTIVFDNNKPGNITLVCAEYNSTTGIAKATDSGGNPNANIASIYSGNSGEIFSTTLAPFSDVSHWTHVGSCINNLVADTAAGYVATTPPGRGTAGYANFNDTTPQMVRDNSQWVYLVACEIFEEVVVTNNPPVVDAGTNATLEAGITFQLAATASDPDGDILAYLWEQLAGVAGTFSATNVLNPTFTPALATGSVTLQLTADDGLVTASDQVLYVIDDTTVPVITRLGSASVNVDEGDTYTDAGFTALDNVDGDITNAIVIGNPVNTSIPAVYTVTADVDDLSGNSAVQVTRAVTVIANGLPVVDSGVDATVEAGAVYQLAATATDPDGDALTYTWSQTLGTTGAFSATNVLNPTFTPALAVGSVTLQLSVNDGVDTVTDTIVLTVEDTVIPVITRIGSASVVVSYGDIYTDAGFTAVDNVDGNITNNIIINNPVNTLAPAVYTVTANVTDASGNVAVQKTRTVTVNPPPNTAPDVDAGANTTIEVGSTHQLTATATDADLDVLTYTWTQTQGTAGTFSATNVLNPTFTAASVVETVVLQLSVFDGTTSTADIVILTVVDTTIPVITLVGDASVNVAFGSVYTDAGATATDNIDGNLTGDIVVTNPVNTSIAGMYTVRYNVSDLSGNAAVEVTRLVTVSVEGDVVLPVITLIGDSVITIEKGTPYVDAGATATDDVDGDITADIVVVGTVDVEVEGTYTITYNVADTAGNDALEVIRTVVVVCKLVVDVPDFDIGAGTALEQLARIGEGRVISTLTSVGQSCFAEIVYTGEELVTNVPVDFTEETRKKDLRTTILGEEPTDTDGLGYQYPEE